jgi:TPR repeat protein
MLLAPLPGAAAPISIAPIAPAPGRLPEPLPADLADLPTATLMERGLQAFNAGRHAEARTLFRLLAQRDIPSAETLLGTMAAKGQGGPRDEAVAAAWFLRAARRGYAPAQLALANAFTHGRGVPQDGARAKALAKAAAAQGQPGAAQLAARLGPERYAQLTGGRP